MSARHFVRTLILAGLFVAVVGVTTVADEAKPQEADKPEPAVKSEPEAKPEPVAKPEAETKPEAVPAKVVVTPDEKKASTAFTSGPVKVTVVAVKGSVEYREGPGQPWKKATKGLELTGNAEISTGLTGEAVLKFDTSADVTVRRLTQVRIAQLEKTERANVTKLDVKYGILKAKIKKGTLANDFKVKTARFSLSVTGTDIASVGFYKGFGGHTQMGGHGSVMMHGKMGPMSLGAGEGSDDKGTPPTDKSKKKQHTNTTFTGTTKTEKKIAGRRGRGMPQFTLWENQSVSGSPLGKKTLFGTKRTRTLPTVPLHTVPIIPDHDEPNGEEEERPPTTLY